MRTIISLITIALFIVGFAGMFLMWNGWIVFGSLIASYAGTSYLHPNAGFFHWLGCRGCNCNCKNK